MPRLKAALPAETCIEGNHLAGCTSISFLILLVTVQR